jgi:hypothetical protein
VPHTTASFDKIAAHSTTTLREVLRAMRTRHLICILFLIAASAGCARNNVTSDSQSPPSFDAAPVQASLRAFMATVATDVTQQGPVAWRAYFDDTPSFFMAVNGQMAFPNGAAAQDGIQKVALTLKHIDLKWGDDLRIDCLTPQLATVAASWRETQIDSAGHTIEESGFFTGLAEFRNGRWQFRNAHWSSPVPPAR